MTRKENIRFVVTSALIAAIYVGLTYLSNAFGLAYGAVQLRISEVMTILPIFTPAAIPGLTLGCFIANIESFPADLVFGPIATLIAAILTRAFRNIKFKELPLLAILPPVLVNAIVIGFELSIFIPTDKSILSAFAFSAFTVGLGQFVVCYVLGIPFYISVKKYRIFERDNFSR